MFDELRKYKKNDHFFFKKGDKLTVVSEDVPELPGIYYIIRLAEGHVELVYIGKSGIAMPGVENKDDSLKGSIIDKQHFLDVKLSEKKIDALDIYWFVTMDGSHNDLPAYVEGLILQRIFDARGRLPEWNKKNK